MKNTILTAVENDEKIIRQASLSKKTMLPELIEMGVGVALGIFGLVMLDVSLVFGAIGAIGFLWAIYSIKWVISDCFRYLVMSSSPAIAYTDKKIYVKTFGATIFKSQTTVIPYSDVVEIKTKDSTFLKIINHSKMLKYGSIVVTYSSDNGDQKIETLDINHYKDFCDELVKQNKTVEIKSKTSN